MQYAFNPFTGNFDAVGDSPYKHTQSAPDTTWTINHNLGRIPSAVATLDSAGTLCYGRVEHPSENQTLIIFGAAFSGTAYLR